MPADDDSALAQAAQDGDMAAFGLLLARHHPVLLALCRRTLGDPTLAEDAAQEASLQALINLDRLQQCERFGSWLAGIGLNVCRMWLRGRARECWSWDALNKTLERSEGTGAEITEVAGRILRLVTNTEWQSDPEVHVEVADLSACVRRAVDTLPHGQRRAVLLFYLSGLSYKETACLLGIEVGAVRTRLHKARGALRGHLRALGEEEHLVMGSEQTRGGTTVEGEQRKVHTCSFCGKKNHEVRRMIAGPGAIICNECIDLCNQIIAEKIAQEEATASAQ